MATTTLNPTVDGRIARVVSGESWTTIRSGAGNTTYETDVNGYIPSLDGGTSPNYVFHARGLFIFDTSVLPDNITINSVTLRMYVNAKLDNHGLGFNVVSATTASDTGFATSDYNIVNYGSTRFLDSDIDITSVTTGQYLEMTLNASGEANINTTGYSKFGIRFDADIDNTSPTFNAGVSGLQVLFNENGSNPVELVIDYDSDMTGSTPKKLTIDSSKVSGSSNLTNFPVLVKDSNIQSAVYSSLSLGSYSLDLERSSSQYAAITDGSQTGLDITGDISIVGWVNLEALPSTLGSTSAEWYTIAGKYNTTGNQRSYGFWVDHLNQLRFTYSSDGTYGSVATDEDTDSAVFTSSDVGKWVHIAVTVDVSAKDIKFYRNGTEVAATQIQGTSTSIYNGSADFRVGSNGASLQLFDGKQKHIRVYSDIRTPGEIVEDMNNSSITDANLQGEWSFENVYTDASGNGNTLTASGSPVFSSTDVPNKLAELRFTSDSAGTTELPFEIVSLDTVAETAEIWVKVPTVSYNTDTDFYMWYGNSSSLPYAADDIFGSQNVWTDYQLVYHFEGTSVLDSTANANTGTNSGTILDTAGKIGSAREWDTAGDYITGGSGTSIDDTFAGGATITAWVNPDSDGISNTFAYIAEKKASVGWIFGVDPLSASDLPVVFIHDFSTTRGKWTTTAANLPINTWSKVAIKYNNASTANNPVLTIDGSTEAFTENETPSGTRSDDSSSTLYLGQNDGGSRTWDGHIDELRIRDGETTTDWDVTEYNNQNSPSTFLTMSDAFTPDANLTLMGVG